MDELQKCIICLECVDVSKNYLDCIDIFYYKPCNCKPIAHLRCLLKWYNKTQKCPYCRNAVEKCHHIKVLGNYLYWIFHCILTILSIYTIVETIIHVFHIADETVVHITTPILSIIPR